MSVPTLKARPRPLLFAISLALRPNMPILRLMAGLFLLLHLCVLPARATLFSDVAGVVHDLQHRPLAAAQVELKAKGSAFTVMTRTKADGSFRFVAVPFGEYTLTVSHDGFEALSQAVTVFSDTSPILHLALPVLSVRETVTVNADPDAANVSSVTPTVLLGQATIANTPGADRSDSLAMVTDYVPGAYITHDMLHMRGGHQVSWLLDGVEIPNTNIASNLGPQIAPRDIQYLQVDRGSYNADVGDRTYGVFNVVPRTGFERNREGELVLTAGNFFQTSDQISLGDNSKKFAWYTS